MLEALGYSVQGQHCFCVANKSWILMACQENETPGVRNVVGRESSSLAAQQGGETTQRHGEM